MKILICEDDFMMVKAIEHRLWRDNHHVVVASDGKMASEKLRSESFELVITDLLMPFFGGLELINLMRNELKLTTPIIVLSKLGNESTILEAFKLGANDYLTKPFSPNELSIRINKFIPAKRPVDPELKEVMIDLTYLKEISGGDKAFINEMINFFIDNTPAILHEMQNIIMRKDFQSLQNLTNKFIHQLSFVGLNNVITDVEVVDQIAASGRDLNRLPSLMDKITNTCFKAIEELKKVDRYSL